MSSSDEPTPSDVPESPASFGVRAFGHRSWWDGSYQVVFTTDRPASTTTRRTGIRAPRPTTAPPKTIRELVRKGSTLLTDE